MPYRFAARVAVLAAALAWCAVLNAQNKPAPAKTAAQKPAAADGTVYLSPTCGCCSKWIDHMKAAGFNLTREVTAQLDAVPARQRVPEPLRSCHTALIGKYLVEGHVPADVVRKLQRETPAGVVGLSVPNMPVGSPGMEGANPRSYSIIAFKADGSSYEFARK
jgi:hypothetical protein